MRLIVWSRIVPATSPGDLNKWYRVEWFVAGIRAPKGLAKWLLRKRVGYYAGCWAGTPSDEDGHPFMPAASA